MHLYLAALITNGSHSQAFKSIQWKRLIVHIQFNVCRCVTIICSNGYVQRY